MSVSQVKPNGVWIKETVVVLLVSLGIYDTVVKNTPESVYEGNISAKTGEVSTENEGMEAVDLLYGEWKIEWAVLESDMYTGTSMDGNFECDLFAPEDYVGYTLKYSEESFSLGDVEYSNPCYVTSEITVEEYNEGGFFRNPDLYTLIEEEEIEVEKWNNISDLSHAALMKIEVKFDYETDYFEYHFIPVGTQAVLLNHDTMLIGIWGKILLAHKM